MRLEAFSMTFKSPIVPNIETRKHGGRIRINSAEPERAATTLASLIRDGLQVTEFHREERNLEDAFIDILGRLDQGQIPSLSQDLEAKSPSE